MENESGFTAITTPEGIARFAMASAIGRLKIEVVTGLGSRVNTLQAVQRLYGVKAKTRKGALKEMLALYESTYQRAYGA